MLSHKDFARKTHYNIDTQNQIWMSNIADSHDCWCDCDTPFAHLFASIFPPGHRDRNKTIEEILIRDYKQKCHSGGPEEEKPGMAAGNVPQKEDIKEEHSGDADADLDALLAAAVDAEEGLR